MAGLGLLFQYKIATYFSPCLRQEVRAMRVQAMTDEPPAANQPNITRDVSDTTPLPVPVISEGQEEPAVRHPSPTNWELAGDKRVQGFDSETVRCFNAHTVSRADWQEHILACKSLPPGLHVRQSLNPIRHD